MTIGYRGKRASIVIMHAGLAIVALWFGLNEILMPQAWIEFVPSFLGAGLLASSLVILHGIILTLVGIALAINLYPKITSGIFSLLLIEIIVSNAIQLGISDIVIRDIGLLGATLAILFAT